MIDFFIQIDYLLLIFCRVFFAWNFTPIVTETKLPALARGGLSLILTLVVYSVLPNRTLNYAGTFLSYFILIIQEIMVGLIISFGISLFFQIYYFVGHLLSTQGGLGMSMVMDPISSIQVPLLGKLYYMVFSAIFIITGGYHWFIKTLVESFTTIKVGGAFLESGQLLEEVVKAVTLFFEIGFKLAAPIMAVLFIIDCGLGILARVVPQMNMFVIGLPLKLLILLGLVIITIGLLPTFNDTIITYTTDFVEVLIRWMGGV